MKDLKNLKSCPKSYILAVNDTLNVISGKWKLPVIAALFGGGKRYKDLQESIQKITPRMLSKELKELELNGIVVRTVKPSQPVLIEYSLSESGRSLSKVIDVLLEWGLEHRTFVLKAA